MCFKADRPHQAYGLCSRCYMRRLTSSFCLCGCGEPVTKHGNKAHLYKKGHWLRTQLSPESEFQVARKKSMEGENNPQYGKFGKDHPAYGHRTSDETRKSRSERALKRISSKSANPTDIETILSGILNTLNIKHISQKTIKNKFVVDEYLPECGLIIEAFGGYWHGDPRKNKYTSSLQAKNIVRDKSRIKYLTKCSFRILILWEKELKENPAWCEAEILLAIENSDIPGVQDFINGESFCG